ncbi:MarR family winged helix-turn-helix transcriptional regulator [Egicoccus sp. AB-alg6-2]|uniref:MarR family winged helix-turn-helix transcriptional regulator n=1 Tax=Egicoccus sp. AB-alg6-2 TaxID=3242692 RepID=UPI00359CC604
MTVQPAGSAEGNAAATAPRLDDLIRAERDIVDRLAALDVEVDFDALSVVSNVYRAASAIRRHMEQTVLGPAQLSWTAFVTLWVLWIWGEMEARHLAAEANVTKGTLTGVLDTLERRELLVRRRHEDDRRLVSVALTEAGEQLIAAVYPAFNAQESHIAAQIPGDQRETMAHGLREIVRRLGD